MKSAADTVSPNERVANSRHRISWPISCSTCQASCLPANQGSHRGHPKLHEAPLPTRNQSAPPPSLQARILLEVVLTDLVVDPAIIRLLCVRIFLDQAYSQVTVDICSQPAYSVARAAIAGRKNQLRITPLRIFSQLPRREPGTLVSGIEGLLINNGGDVIVLFKPSTVLSKIYF